MAMIEVPTYVSTVYDIECYTYQYKGQCFVFRYWCKVCDEHVNLGSRYRLPDKQQCIEHNCNMRDDTVFVINFTSIVEKKELQSG
jgi:hypothetical protein